MDHADTELETCFKPFYDHVRRTTIGLRVTNGTYTEIFTGSVQIVSGLVIACTDIYYPPLGQHFAKSIAVDSRKLALIKPYSKENVDERAYQAMREIQKPFITAHVYSFYTLLFYSIAYYRRDR